MKIHIKFSIIISAVLSLVSCTDVMENTYSKKTAEGDLERIKAIQRLDSSSYEILTDYMLKHGLIEPDLKHIDQTYTEILEQAKKEKEQMEKAKEKRKTTERGASYAQFMNDHMDHMHKALLMIPEKSEIRKDWSTKNSFFYRMVFVNPGYKTVRAFKGRFTFYDIFDTELKTVNFTFNDSIPALDTLAYVAALDLNNLSGHTIYVTTDYKDMKVVWQPTKILFADGTFLE